MIDFNLFINLENRSLSDIDIKISKYDIYIYIYTEFPEIIILKTGSLSKIFQDRNSNKF